MESSCINYEVMFVRLIMYSFECRLVTNLVLIEPSLGVGVRLSAGEVLPISVRIQTV